MIDPTLALLERCFGGAVPAVVATASADGIPNVTTPLHLDAEPRTTEQV